MESDTLDLGRRRRLASMGGGDFRPRAWSCVRFGGGEIGPNKGSGVLVVGGWFRGIVGPTKDVVVGQLSGLELGVQAVVAGASCAFWDVLTPTVGYPSP